MSRRLVPILLLGALACSGAAEAKSFRYPSIEVKAEVRSDGSMHVREVRQYDFRGNFHEAWRKIPVAPQVSVVNVALTEDGKEYREGQGQQPGTYRVGQSFGETAIFWYYDIADRVATFTLDYDVLGAVEKHADVAQLYWKFIEPDRGTEVKQARVTVSLPPGISPDSVRAYAHGPLWGEVLIGSSEVVATCAPLPDGKMLELRVLLPSAAIASSPRQYGDAIEARVLGEEQRWAAEANGERKRARAKAIIPALITLAALAAWLTMYISYGREYKEHDLPQYLREPPADWTPNELAYLWRWKQLTPADMTATLMDLVRRGALRLIVKTERHERLGGLLGEKVEQEYEIERVPERQQDMSGSERYLVNHILFDATAGNVVSLEGFAKNARAHPTASQQRFKHWKKAAEKEAARIAVVDPKSNTMLGVGIAIGAAAFFVSVMLGGVLQSPFFFASGAVGFAMVPASYALLRRTPQAARELHKWQAFRRYLTDFSQMKDYPAPAMALWEQYLVYAITLGVADRVIEQFKELYPKVAEQTSTVGAFPYWVSASGSPLGAMDSIGSALSSFSSTLATATSSFSSSSGSGGGFSGGGGGGGGGGSSGAR